MRYLPSAAVRFIFVVLIVLAGSPLLVSAQSTASAYLKEQLTRIYLNAMSGSDLDSVLDSVFDLDAMSANQLEAVAKVAAAPISDEQRSRFRTLYRSLVFRSFRKTLGVVKLEKKDFISTRQDVDGNVTTVHTITSLGESDLDQMAIDYKLTNSAAGWRVVDYLIEGVSITSSYRSQFTKIAKEQGIETLLERMKSKLDAAGDDEKRPAKPSQGIR